MVPTFVQQEGILDVLGLMAADHKQLIRPCSVELLVLEAFLFASINLESSGDGLPNSIR